MRFIHGESFQTPQGTQGWNMTSRELFGVTPLILHHHLLEMKDKQCVFEVEYGAMTILFLMELLILLILNIQQPKNMILSLE